MASSAFGRETPAPWPRALDSLRSSRLSGPYLLLTVVLVVQALALGHEISIGRQDLNDHVFHLALIEDTAEAMRRGANPVDFWAEEWSLGYPVLRTYQPLGPLTVAGLSLVTDRWFETATLFAAVRWLILFLWPLSVYFGARWLGLAPWPAAASACLAPLVSTNGLFGLELGSYLWRGSGLFTQSLAMHFFALGLGLGARSLRSGRQTVAAGLLLGACFLSHFIYGYMAAVSLLLLALLERPLVLRLRRTAVVGTAALLTAAPILLPLILDMPSIQRSRWEPAWKWDSWGADQILSWLSRGDLLDFGRFPSLTLMALLGAVAVLAPITWQRKTLALSIEERSGLATLVGAGFWILLFFGRPTWGDSLRFLGLGELTHLHRLIGAVHFFLILLAGIGITFLVTTLRRRAGHSGTAVAVGVVLLLVTPAAMERAAFIDDNRTWGQENLEAHHMEAAQLRGALELARDSPGRVFPGLGGGWGKDFRVGWVPLSAHLSTARIPALAYLYHSMAATGDLMVHFDERLVDHFRIFHVTSVLAPAGRPVAPFLEPAGRSGRFQLWRAPDTGYFDLVTAEHQVAVDRSSFYEASKAWLDSPWPAQRRHLVLTDQDTRDELVPWRVGDPLPRLPAADLGRVRWQERRGDVFRAQVDAESPCHLLFKMTHHRGWRALVDGRPQPTVRLSPGFVGVALEPGDHEIELRYRPEAWRAPLALGCAVLLGLLLLVQKSAFFAPSSRREVLDVARHDCGPSDGTSDDFDTTIR